MEDNENRTPEPEETKQPVDINAMLEDDPEPVDSKELQDSILEDSDMNRFQLWLARMDDKKFTLFQRAAGAVLGVLAAGCLFWDNLMSSGESSNSFSWGLIIAVVIAMWVPNIAEKQGLRKMPKLRVALAIALFVCIVIYFLYQGVHTGWSFRSAA